MIALTENERRLKANRTLVLAISFLSGLSFVGPIWLIYSTAHLHFSTTLATMLFTGMWVLSAFFEIPTGALADRIGRRKIFALGSLLLLLYPVAYLLALPLAIFVVALVVASVGNAMTSGALTPIVHRDYDHAGYSTKKYHKFLATNRARIFIARALSGVVGAILYAAQPWLPFLAWLIVSGCSVMLGLLIKEEKREAGNAMLRLHISATFRAMARSRAVVAALAAYVVINIVTEAIWTGYQVFYQQDGLSPVVFGVLFSVIAVFSATSAYLVRKLYTRFGPIDILAFGAVLACLTSWMLFQGDVWVRILAVVPMAIASGFMAVTVSAVIQHQVENSLQSTALSVYSVVVSVVYGMASLGVGWLLDTLQSDDVRRILLYLAIISSIVTISLALRFTRESKFRLESPDINNEVSN